ncbi:sodium-coupled monocarboxylate transporter 1-like [Uranotaenia lowii]|uniref:sodium-coupled monocarboxylate transporter 1-like n=1 Tax=Uranotaenia lowii TaxID=190385 RepID=UPI00247ACF0D|nr:sodium-coupled monocarboxylate transporter 1-like [Uranotaenia lowii]
MRESGLPPKPTPVPTVMYQDNVFQPQAHANLTDLPWDAVVFVAFILFSTVYPLWSRFLGVKEKSKAEYVFGLGKISSVAMILSISRSTLGVRSVLGYPSELFYRGTAMFETLYGMVAAYPLVCFLFIPVYFNLGITSVYQYLDFRFNSRLVRCLASMTFIIRSILILGVNVFTPSVALKTVLGIPYWISLLGISSLSILINILGGIKAAITADVVQTVTMILISIGIVIQSMVDVGGFEQIFIIPADRDRLSFFNFTGDLTVRVDTTSALLGQLVMSLSIIGCQQTYVQRYLIMKSFKEVRQTLFNNIPVAASLFCLAWIVGFGVFSVYADCDPLKAGYTEKIDEILPFFMRDRFSYLPGMLGLFMASLFNGALSVAISNQNSLATVTWEDFISIHPKFREFTDRQQLTTIKLIATMYGIATMGVGFLVALLPGVIESSMLMTSATTGPLLGVFLLAILVPAANWKGAAWGMIVSHIITLWITFGGLMVEKQTNLLPTSIEGCTYDSITSSIYNITLQQLPNSVAFNESHIDSVSKFHLNGNRDSSPLNIFAISYMYYSIIGTIITLCVGTVVSYLFQSSENAYDHRLLHPLVLKTSRKLPGRERRFVVNPWIRQRNSECSA